MKITITRDQSWKDIERNLIKKYVPVLAEQLNWKSSQIILNYECGSGLVAVDYLLPKVKGNDSQLYCVDSSKVLINKAKKSYPELANIFKHGNILEDSATWPLKGQMVDNILIFQRLLFVTDLRTFFRRIYTQLKFGGQFGTVIPLDVTLFFKLRQLLVHFPVLGQELKNQFPEFAEWACGLGAAQFVLGMAKEAGLSVKYFEISQDSFTYEEVDCLADHFISFLSESTRNKLEEGETKEDLIMFLVSEITKILDISTLARSISNTGHSLQLVVEKIG